MPTATQVNYPPAEHAIFENDPATYFQPPAVMGACELHTGSVNPCAPDTTGATIDLIPRNTELCIDTADDLDTCDPGTGANPQEIPIYSPADGCAIIDSTGYTVQINIDKVDCSQPQNVLGDKEIVLTHLQPNPAPLQSGSALSTGAYVQINAGELVGYLCTNDDAGTTCGVFGGAPTHLAFQLRSYQGSFFQQERDDVLGFLAIPRCLYDDWESDPQNPLATPQRLINSPVRACPAS